MKQHKRTASGGDGPLLDTNDIDLDTNLGNQDQLTKLGDDKKNEEEKETVLQNVPGSLEKASDDEDPSDGSEKGGDKKEEGDDGEEGGDAKASGKGSDEDKSESGDGDEPTEQSIAGKEGAGDGDGAEEEEGEEGGDKEGLNLGSGGDSDASGGDGDVADGAQLTDVPAPVRSSNISFTAMSLDEEQTKKFCEETGRTPQEHGAAIQTRLDGVVSLSNTIAADLMSQAEAAKGTVDGAAETLRSQIASAEIASIGRVETAFTNAASTAIGLIDGGLSTLEGAYTSGQGEIDGVAQGRKDEIGGMLISADEQVALVQETGKGEYQTILETEAKKLVDYGKTVKDAAKKQGDDLAKTYDPKGKKDLESLLEEARKSTVGNVAKGVGSAIDLRIKAHTSNLTAMAATYAETAVVEETKVLNEQVKSTQETADTNIEAGRVTAQATFTSTYETAKDALQTTRDKTEADAQIESDAGVEKIIETAAVMQTDLDGSQEELKSTIESTAATNANGYATVTTMLSESVATLEGPSREDDVVDMVDSATDQLEANHAFDQADLETLASDGMTELEGSVNTKLTELEGATVEQEGQATKFGERITEQVSTSTEGFSTALENQKTSFDKVLADELPAVQESATNLVNGAGEAIDLYKGAVTTALQAVQKELDGIKDAEFAKIPEVLEEKADKAMRAKYMSIVSNDIPALYTAMDGMGTDESGIYSVLRKMTYGQIEALEELWGKYKKHSLRWYFEDEMSGSDLKTAMLYLDHNREKALAMELEDSVGFWNDDEARIDEIMKCATGDEMKALNKNHKGTLDKVKGNLGGADLDTFNALADTSLSRDDAKSKADAIRLFDAMDGMGTDEAAVKKLLEGAKTPEERERLRKQFDAYAKKKGDYNDLDAALKYEFTGTFGGDNDDLHLVQALAKNDRNDAEVAAAKVYEAGEGMGTDEKAMFGALKSDVGKWDKQIGTFKTLLADPNITGIQRKEIEVQMAELQGKKSSHMADLDKYMTDFSGQNMDGYLKSELSEGLELKIAMDTKDKGEPDRADLLDYASSGIGTDEAMFKDALTDDQGNPLSKDEVAKLNKELESRGTSLDKMTEEELGGRDNHDVQKLLLGKPENADDLNKLVQMDHDFETSGMGGFLMDIKGGLGISTAGEEMDYAKDQFDAKYSDMVEQGMNQTKFEELAKSDPELATVIQALGITSQKSSEAYGKSLEATVDGLITALEIIGGVIVTICTAGAASPVLAALIANIAIGAGGIILKKVLVGDAYGTDQMALDFVKKASTAVLGAALSKVDKFGKIADSVGKSGVDMFNKAGQKAGMLFNGKAWEMGPKATAYLQTFISKGTEATMTGAVEDTYGGLWNEQRFDQGMDSWLGGALTDGISNAPTNFMKGGATGMYSKYAGDKKNAAFEDRTGQSAGDGSNVTHGSMSADMMHGAGDSLAKHTIGHFTTFSNYGDAGKFWDGLVSGGPKAMMTGAISAYGSRKAMPANMARDLENGSLSESHYNALKGELTKEEKLEIGRNMPPARQPPDIKALVTAEALASISSAEIDYSSGSAFSVVDTDKLASADAKTIGLALQGGLDPKKIEGRTFSPAEKLEILRYAGGTKKLPPGFVDAGCQTAMALNMSLDQQVAFAVDVGWTELPAELRAQAVFAIKATTPSVTISTLGRFKGTDLPDELKEALGARVAMMSSDEKVKLAQSFGTTDLDKLPASVKADVVAAVGQAVEGGNKDPGLVLAAIANGQMEPSQENLDKLGMSPREKLELLATSQFDKKILSQAPGFAEEALGYMKDMGKERMYAFATPNWEHFDKKAKDTVFGDYWSTNIGTRLALVASIPAGDVPGNVKKAMGAELRAYKINAAFMGTDSLDAVKMAALEAMTTEDTSTPQLGG